MNDEEIKLDPNNYRKHSEQNLSLINKSIVLGGTLRSIATDNDNVIIAGNGVYQEAQKLGIPCRVIETKGDELIVVKRTDLSTNDEKRKLLAMADNRTSDTSEFDFDLLSEDFSLDVLGSDWDFDLSDFGVKNDTNDEFNEFGGFNYVNKDCTAYRQIIVSFDNREDVEEFARLTNLPIRDKTRSIFFPYRDKETIDDAYE